MQPSIPTSQFTFEDTYTNLADSTTSPPQSSSKKRKADASSSLSETEKLKNICLNLQKTVQQQQQTLEQLQKDIKQLSSEMPMIAAMTFRGITECKVNSEAPLTYQPLKIEIVSQLKTGECSTLTLLVDKLKSQKKCRFIQSHLNLSPDDSSIKIDLTSLDRTDFDPKLIADVFFWCQSNSTDPIVINDSNVEIIRSLAIWLGIKKLINRCDQILANSFKFSIIDHSTDKPLNDASLTRLLAIQSSEPTSFLGAKIAEFILNRLLVAPTVDAELHSQLMNYKHYINELVLQVYTKIHFNANLLKDVFIDNKKITKIKLSIITCKEEIAVTISNFVAEIKNLKEVKICAAYTSDIVRFVELLAKSSLKLDLLQLKQRGEEETVCKLIQLPVRSLTDKFEVNHPYVLEGFEEPCDPQNVTCNSFPFNPCGFGTDYDDLKQDLSTEELEFVVKCPSIQELVFDKSFESQYLDTASAQFFKTLAKSNINSLVLPPPYIIHWNSSNEKEKQIDFTALKSLFEKIDNYNKTNPQTKIEHVTLMVSVATEKYQLIGIKHLFNSFKLTVKFVK